jgi:hypothetical protein
MLGLSGRFVFIESSQPATADSILNGLREPSIASGDCFLSPSILEEMYDGSLRNVAVEVKIPAVLLVTDTRI